MANQIKRRNVSSLTYENFPRGHQSNCSPYWGLTPMSLWGWLSCLSVRVSGYHDFSVGRGVDPAGNVPGGG
ncbi:hypothetical protein F511_21014 [Dorcoceras hygrometricum]|uniref:Uncharacterized protein n=1 Tax=Dorcoceras hygrometricum TaxID=472368 RepID=A0A2Z7ASD1_9LAMI|nr:hypothetical protein F511_21014 [Dorcoceras hygrometricum]